MIAAANYAWCNRQVLAHQIRQAFEDVLAGRVADWDLRQVYDIAHNMAKLEVHDVDGRPLRVCVHRKGATRAFGPGNAVLPDDYRAIGQPVLVPGSMGTASWVLVGTEGSMNQTFGSTCHGAGRTMSRSRAKKEVRGADLKERLEAAGHRRARRQPGRSGRGGAGRLQGRGQRGRCGGRRGDCAQGGALAAHRGRQRVSFGGGNFYGNGHRNLTMTPA